MARFKLSLITPNNDKSVTGGTVSEHFLRSTITNYQDQINTFNEGQSTVTIPNNLFTRHINSAYSYNEKLSLHTNGQKSLTFSMDAKILTENQYIENPFVRLLAVGTQLELDDKFGNCYLFTVTKVAYTFSNLNTTYNFTCEDSFTYQLSRQNNGYTITNDETSTDFIGALDLNQWADKIQTECYITYQYLYLNQGLALTTDNYLVTYGSDDENYDANVTLDTNRSIQKILKTPYNQVEYPDFYITVPFSVSGSNAAAALIALAETVGLQVQIAEGILENNGGVITYGRYFWFAPTKTESVTGLSYSPRSDIQTFNIDFSGQSLTTILNVSSTTVDDEEIGLLPSVPAYFINFFNTPEWKSSTYYPGYFVELATGSYQKELTLSSAASTASSDGAGGTLILLSLDTGSWPTHFNQIQWYWDRNKYLDLQVGTNTYTPFTHTFGVGFKVNTNNESSIMTYLQHEDIPTYVLENYTEAYLWLPYLDLTDASISEIAFNTTFFKFTRNYTEDELEFANVAEKIPWLENKLIDFTYFLKQNVLSRAEYETLMQFILNNIRIVNGELLSYSGAYYRALHEQTKIIANLQSSLDTLGATYYSEVLRPYELTGALTGNYKEFIRSYNLLFNTTAESSDVTTLLNWENLISTNFNKYFNAEQRFLKHMYSFRQYFNSRNSFATSASTVMRQVRYSIAQSIQTTTETNETNFTFYSFNGGINFKTIDTNIINAEYATADTSDNITNPNIFKPLVPIYKYETGKYIKQNIPDATLPTSIVDGVDYTFYVAEELQEIGYPISTTEAFNNNNYYFIEDSIYDALFGENDVDSKTITLEDQTEKTVKQVSALQLMQLFLYHKEGESYYYPSTTPVVADNIFNMSDADIEKMKEYIPNNENIELLESMSSDAKYIRRLYYAQLPIDSVYIKDYCFQDNNGSIEIWDENDKPYQYDGSASAWYKYNYKTQAYDISIETSNFYKPYYAVPYVKMTNNLSVVYGGDWSDNETQSPFLTLNDHKGSGIVAWQGAAKLDATKPAEVQMALTYATGYFTYWWNEYDDPQLEIPNYNPNTDYGDYDFPWDLSQEAYTITHIPYIKSTESIFNITQKTPLLAEAVDASFFTAEKWMHYYNVFSQVGLSYQSIKNLDAYRTTDNQKAYTFYVAPQNLHFITKTEALNLNRNDTYYWIEMISDLTMTEKHGAIKYYPLIKAGNKLDLSLSLFDDYTNQDGTINLNSLPTNTYWNTSTDSNYYQRSATSLDGTSTNKTYRLARLENFTRNIVNDIDWDVLLQNITNFDVYKWATNQQFSLKDLTISSNKTINTKNVIVYKMPMVSDVLRPAVYDDWLNELKIGRARRLSSSNKPSYHYWYLNNDINKRTYSLVELLEENNTKRSSYSYLAGDVLTELEITDNANSIEGYLSTEITRLTGSIDSKGNLIINSKSETVTYSGQDKDGNDKRIHFDGDGKATVLYGSTYLDLTKEAIGNYIEIGTLTNGEFWYFYHNYLEIPELQAAAAVIETELSTHWASAYNASQYCRWFIPEFWQVRTNDSANGFAKLIFYPYKDGNSQHVSLMNTFVPIVRMYRYQDELDLPNYTFYFNSSRATTYEKGHYPVSELPDLKENPSWVQIRNHVLSDEDPSIDLNTYFTAVPNGTRRYYYVNDGEGGTLRKNIIRTLGGPEVFDYFDGLYGMQLRRLRLNYTAKQFPQYERLKADKLAFWKDLYTRYPGIFLENTFSNDDVRSSSQLYEMANLFFKDYKNPEKNYSITTIDMASLKGYTGQEITIGSSILVNSLEYFDAVDAAYRATDQYLFVSDISYTLRQDSDINLTVNSIKYQDKLIQRLVKLIR